MQLEMLQETVGFVHKFLVQVMLESSDVCNMSCGEQLKVR